MFPHTNLCSTPCLRKDEHVEMVCQDRTAFETIEAQFGVNDSAEIDLMRRDKRMKQNLPVLNGSGRKAITAQVTEHRHAQL